MTKKVFSAAALLALTLTISALPAWQSAAAQEVAAARGCSSG